MGSWDDCEHAHIEQLTDAFGNSCYLTVFSPVLLLIMGSVAGHPTLIATTHTLLFASSAPLDQSSTQNLMHAQEI